MEITVPILSASALCRFDPFNLYALRHKSSTDEDNLLTELRKEEALQTLS